jgi:hypothetical protein
MQLFNNVDKLVETTNLPLASAGAPIPVILADEHTVVLEYYMQDGLIKDGEEVDQVAIVTFSRCLSYSSGPPNEEAISGHPLYKKGLRPYSFFRVNNSSMINRFKNMNKVHPYHNDSLYDDYVHYILCFHDSIFECISKDVTYEISTGTLFENVDLMKTKLW